MSLFLEDRISEQKVDPENDVITFSYPWIVNVPVTNDEDALRITSRFGTNYENGEAGWFGMLSLDKIACHSISSYHNGDGSICVWNGTCFISYVLYSGSELHTEFYGSPKTATIATPNRDSFKTPEGFMTKFAQAFANKQVSKMVIYIELELPAKLFYQPFKRSSTFLTQKYCTDFPENIENDFRFAFLKKSDFTIKCSDGEMPSIRSSLYLSSRFMRNYLMVKPRLEFTTEHSIDVIKPLVIFLHTFCFKMPETYDLAFAKRLLQAIDLFIPEQKFKIIGSIHQSLCQKFVKETHDFDSVLRWVSIACQQALPELQNMIASLIVNKYYFKWQQTFPEASRNTGNQLFDEIFGSTNEDIEIFDDVDDIYFAGFFTTVILN